MKDLITVRTKAPEVTARIYVNETVVVVGLANESMQQLQNPGHQAETLCALACSRDKVQFDDGGLLLDGNHVYLPKDSLGRAVQFLREHGIHAELWTCD